jgi:DNA-binding response OmpR family regulator
MPVRALFVDDEPSIVALFRTVLEMQGYVVRCASSASEACAVLSSQSFDLVVTDMHMETPVAGRQVIRAAARHSPRPAIVILTSYLLAEEEWREAGADDFLLKGTEVPIITRRLRALVSRAAGAA